MNRSLQIKLILIAFVVAWSAYSLWPTLQMARGTEGMTPQEISNLEDRAIKRGLDLKGGMYLVLELDETQLEGLDRGEAMDRVIGILRNRIDQFGVSEPVIQREGDQRIVVQLPGLQDAARAKELIGSTARLEFRMVREASDVNTLMTRLDRALAGTDAIVDSTSADGGLEAVADSNAFVDPFSTDSGATDLADAAAAALDERPFSSRVRGFDAVFGGLVVAQGEVASVTTLLNTPEAKRVLPRDAELLFGKESYTSQTGEGMQMLYLVATRVDLEGGEIESAVVEPDQDPSRPGALQVGLRLGKRGALKFSNVTGANVGRKLGIVLDGKVQSAPTINGKISGGRASISGGFDTGAEARDLALMLRAGALPVDVHIEEERTVGPTLGKDSIEKGVRSVLIGGVAVIIFMLIYYRAAGLIATAGLIVTLLALMGILAQLKLTLTLPGIAGIILTVGMAVDSNVLIFERIREELRGGRSVRGAIDAGYAQATRTITDANVTTFLAAIVLWYFGTGPIKGFAVTLTIGIATSMFSALVFTRSMYELWLGQRSPKNISI